LNNPTWSQLRPKLFVRYHRGNARRFGQRLSARQISHNQTPLTQQRHSVILLY